jgi:hypothetical protein
LSRTNPTEAGLAREFRPDEASVRWTLGRAVARSASAEGERRADFPDSANPGAVALGGRGIAAARRRAAAAGFVDGQIRRTPALRPER